MNYQHLESYYKGKKVFLTGHTGFKGSWMLSWLHLLGAEIKGYALAPENDFDLYHAISGDSKCESIIADIRDKIQLEKEILSFKPDFVFHLAAQPLVRQSYEIPVCTFEINTIGTANVLNAIRGLNKPCTIICITTDKVYENADAHYPYKESDKLGGSDPYSASKACAELVISSYRNSFFNANDYDIHQKSLASARSGNVIGGGDWAKDRIIPDIVRALKKGKPIVIRNPFSIRPWQHVLEAIGGYLHLGTKMISDPIKFSQAWNFGPLAEDNLTVIQLVEIAIEVWGEGAFEKSNLTEQPHEAEVLKLDISKTTNLLGWSPKSNASMAIARSIDWYKKQDYEKQITSNQIIEYQS